MLSLSCLLAPVMAVAAGPEFYVAPDGNDRHPGTEAQPFATVERAQQAVRQVNRKMTTDVTVVLRGAPSRPPGILLPGGLDAHPLPGGGKPDEGQAGRGRRPGPTGGGGPEAVVTSRGSQGV